MYDTHKINENILNLVKSGNMSSELAVSILKKINSKEGSKKTKDIAIIGMACRFPGADDINQYWENLINEVNSIGSFPDERVQDLLSFEPDLKEKIEKSGYVAGYLRNIADFDHEFFHISYEDAIAMEPYQRLFLETAYQALKNGGYDSKLMQGTLTGTYVGLETASKVNYSVLLPKQDMSSFVGSVPGLLSNRLSYYLDLRGPGMVINTACSSGLVALHEAVQALKNGECDMAIAGGVNLMIFPQLMKNMEELETYDGKVKAFDKNADGTIWSEGVAAVLLKPVDAALRDHDRIHAVIKASGVNSDGTSNGLTAPNPDAETQLFIRTWENAQIDPCSISYIEAHGTGTLLGDSIEIQALCNAFSKYTSNTNFCGIGSVKTNIGHTVAASGLASLIKVVMALKHKQIPATLNFHTANPFIDFEKSALYVNTSLKEWKRDGQLLRAGVNAFGFGGTNCHIVLEEAPGGSQCMDKEEVYAFHGSKLWPKGSGERGYAMKQEMPGQHVVVNGEELYYNVKWMEIKHIKKNRNETRENIMLITDKTDWGKSLSEGLKISGNKIITAWFGSGFNKIAEENYVISAGYGDLERLVQVAKEEGIEKIILAADAKSYNEDNFSSLNELLERTLYCGFYLSKALYRCKIGKIQLVFLGENAQRVTDSEQNVIPPFATLFGLGKVIREELPGILCKCVDYDKKSSVDDIISAIYNNFRYYMTALRDSKLYYPLLATCDVHSLEKNNVQFEDGGVYLITGGTGGIGLEIADYIAGKFKVNLILLSRTEFPPRNEWENYEARKESKISSIITAVRKIEQNGSNVLLYNADVTRESDVKNTMVVIKNRYGKLDGIIHAAGNPGNGMIISEDDQTFTNSIAPKVQGTWLLNHFLDNGNPPKFEILFSSIASLAGGAFLGGYVAANCYMDAYSNMSSEKTRIISINWTTWKDTGMMKSVNQNFEAAFRAIAKEDAVKALETVISRDVNNIVIGEVNYDNSLFWNGTLPIELSPSIRRKIKAPEKELNVVLTGRNNEIYSDYEKKIANIWGNVFNIANLSIEDNFFELGGTSIIGIRIANRINEEFHIMVTLKDIFTYITIEEQAEFVVNSQCETAVWKGSMSEETVDKNIIMPLSHSQRRMWFFQKMNPTFVASNLLFMRIYDEYIDVQVLKKAIDEMVYRHVMLRTIFYLRDGVPFQEVIKKYEPAITQVDLTGYRDCVTVLRKEIFEQKMKPFSLETPPYRITLYKLSEEKYCFSVIFHHIIIDGWGMEVFNKELLELYKLFLNNRTVYSFERRYSYIDWITEQSNWEQTEEFKTQEAYWIKELQKPLPVMELPIDKKRPVTPSFNGSYYRFKINNKLSEKIKRHVEKNQFTVNNYLMCVFLILLHKLSQENDIIIGVPTAGRSKKTWENVIGVLINTVCIRIKFDEVVSFLDLEKKINVKVLDAIDNSRYPFDLIVEKINPVRDVVRNPIYNVLFQLYDNIGLENDGVSQFELSCLCKNIDDEIEISFEYSSDLFQESSIVEFSKYYLNILNQVIYNPECSIKSLDLMNNEQKEALFANIQEVNNENVLFGSEQVINRLFEKQAEKTPLATAIVWQSDSLTYRELNERSNQLARYLYETGDCYHKPVCIMIRQSINTVSGILAILKAGGTYVPVDPDYPEERINYILNNCEASVIVTESEYVEKVKNIISGIPKVVQIIVLNDKNVVDKYESYSVENLETEQQSSDLMYIIYTSGSTGNPKGVMVTHKNVSNFLNWAICEIKIGMGNTLMLVSSVSFDISVFEIFGTLLSGAKLCILSNEMRTDMNLLMEYMIENAVDIWHSVPSFMVQMLNQLKSSKEDNQVISFVKQLKYIMIGGEAWSTKLAVNIQQVFTNAVIRNMYGPTEATIWVTSYEVREKLDEERYPVMLLGRPVSNNQVIILDNDGKLCPPRVNGEIYISGKNVTNGYFKDDIKTREVFLTRSDGTVYYKTGDLGRYLPDGNIEYIGRKDNMVKVRGYRIELGEIENAVLAIPEIKQTALAIVQEGESNKIVCFYVSEKDYQVYELKNILRRKLPEYMIPAQIFHVGKLLFTANGKTDWKAMIKAVGTGKSEYQAARDKYDEKLKKIWMTLLQIPDIGITENFFDMGGNSILYVKMQEMIEEEFSINVSVIDLLRYTSIEALSDYLKNGRKEIGSRNIGSKKAELRKKMRRLRQ